MRKIEIYEEKEGAVEEEPKKMTEVFYDKS